MTELGSGNIPIGERLMRYLHAEGHRRFQFSLLRRGFATAAWAGWMAGMLWRHPLSLGRRGQVMSSAIAWQLWRRLAPGGGGVAVRVNGGPDIYFPDWSKCAMSSVTFGFGDPEQVFLWRYLRPGDVLVDVGANVGTYSALALALGAEVEAFEPDSQSSLILRENLTRNGSAWKLHRAAVADVEGDAAFSSSLDISNHLLMDTMHGLPSETTAEEQVTVPVLRLDTLRSSGKLSEPTVLKTDAEGFDFQVLAGAEDILRQSMPLVIAEVWGGGIEIRNLLEQHGYVITQIHDRMGTPVRCKGGDVSDGNIIAIPKEHWAAVFQRLDEHAIVPRQHKVTWKGAGNR